MTRRRRALAGAAVATAACGLAAACVGPAPTTTVYAAKAAHAAESGASGLATAEVAVEARLDDRMPANYLDVVLSDAEDSVDSVRSQFGSIQPPDTASADHLRNTLGDLLTDAADQLTEVRVDARRGDTAKLSSGVHALADLADQLSAFATEHAG